MKLIRTLTRNARPAYRPALLLITLSAFALFLFSGCKTTSRISGVVPFSSLPSLSEDLILENSGLTRGKTGYILYDPTTQRTLAQLNAQKAYLPGSVSKIVTVVAALKILGPDFRFHSLLTHTGKVTQGVLEGDLYLVGAGDPFLNLSDLMAMVQSLKARGIKKVHGRFFYDDHGFASQAGIDLKRDRQGAHNTGVSPLSSEFNRAILRWKPATQGTTPQSINPPKQLPASRDVVQAYAVPYVPGLELGLLSREEMQENWIEATEDQKSKWLLSPLAPHEGQQGIPIHTPALTTAYLFQQLAAYEGISLSIPVPKDSPSGAMTVVKHPSLPLLELSEKVLEFSNNLMAELILVATAKKLAPTQAMTVQTSAEIVGHWLKKQLPETSWEDFQFETGSGLGSGNRMTPAQLMAVLGFAEKLSLGGREFSSLLPVSGWKGTLANRMNDPDIALRVWAKTGGLHFTRTLAGSVYVQSGKKLRFVIFNTDFKNRTLVEDYDSILPPDLAQGVRAFSKKAETFQEQILLRWIQQY